jgi:hypothetical protein
MKNLALLVVAIGALIALPAVAQAPPAAERVRVAGAVQKLDGDRLTVNAAGGGTQTVTLSADAQIYRVEKRHFSDIRPGDFVASGTRRDVETERYRLPRSEYRPVTQCERVIACPQRTKQNLGDGDCRHGKAQPSGRVGSEQRRKTPPELRMVLEDIDDRCGIDEEQRLFGQVSKL